MSLQNSFLVFQSLWAMEYSDSQGQTPALEKSMELIKTAGFDGFTDHFYDRGHVKKLASLKDSLGLQVEGQVFPTSIDELKPAIELGAEFACHHITIQADLRPRTVKEAISIIEGWQRLAETVSFPVLIETHRYRLTNDLLFTLDVIEQMPNLKLLADLSHYVVARELPMPLSEQDNEHIETILDHSWGFHGRVSNGHQVQVPITFAQHQAWLDVFKKWWIYGMKSWQKRAQAYESLSFTCELGPKPYAISDKAGNDLVNRWDESLLLKDIALACWQHANHNE